MIFYFSGTGSSKFAAKTLATELKEELICISDALFQEGKSMIYHLAETETVGFVFPVYGWGPPKVVLEFIEKMELLREEGQDSHKNENQGKNKGWEGYLFAVCTCGSSAGNTIEILDGALRKKGLCLSSGFSILMPENYVVMFHVDAKEVQENKFRDAKQKLETIVKVVKRREENIFQITRGFAGGFLSRVIYPVFSRMKMRVSNFYVTDACNGCGLCARVCTGHCITINHSQGSKPQWSEHCLKCQACLNHCPKRAIEYGRSTRKKGRYVHPDSLK